MVLRTGRVEGMVNVSAGFKRGSRSPVQGASGIVQRGGDGVKSRAVSASTFGFFLASGLGRAAGQRPSRGLLQRNRELPPLWIAPPPVNPGQFHQVSRAGQTE